MNCFRNIIAALLTLTPVFSFCQTNLDCSDITISSATANGNYLVESYVESDGIRDGDDYSGSTIYYPKNTSGLLAAIIIIPGYANPQLSIQAWGSFLASHGIVCMTIGTNSLLDSVSERKRALQDALISLKSEQVRVNSPLYNKLDTNLIALGGWSMGGGGAQLAAIENPNIKAIVALCPWLKPTQASSVLLNQTVPIIVFSGQLDVFAPPASHANSHYNYTPNSTDKLIYEIAFGGHTIANTPAGGLGDVGRMGLSWLKKYLVNDTCYCPLLLDIPTTSSYYETNIDCSIINGTVDYNNNLMIYPNPANNTIALRGILNKNNNYKIVSIDGRLIKKQILNTSNIDISDLKKGIYFLEYENQKMKLIKN